MTLRKALMLTLTLSLSSFLFLGCESAEVRDIAKAQKCLDDVPQTAPAQADSCFAYVEKYSSQQANILKCSIKLTAGGLNTEKITKAYEASKDTSLSNSSSVFVGFLALDNPTTTGYANAIAAYDYCERSEVSGLLFIAGLAKTATVLARINGGSFNLDDPAATEAAVSAILQNCADGTTSADQCDLTEIGNTIADLSDVYCAGASSDADVCEDINGAIAGSGGNPEEAAKKFMCDLKKGTYANGTCT